MKRRILKLNLDSKKDYIQLLFLLQTFVVMGAMVYTSALRWGLIDKVYCSSSGDFILMGLTILSGAVGFGSIYLFSELVKLLEKEKEYELKKIEILQMQEYNNLLRSQKHDFSNNLQVIWGLLSLGKYDRAREYLEKHIDLLKISEDELDEISNIDNSYLYTLFLNKSHACKEMGIDIHFSVDPVVTFERFNPIDLVRIFGNLIDNAIYAVKELAIESRIIIVDIYSEDENYLFCVYNKGPAIPDSIKDKIFEFGFTTKGKGGSGMGLYNVLEIAHKYKGRVLVESDENKGTRFIINIPKS